MLLLLLQRATEEPQAETLVAESFFRAGFAAGLEDSPRPCPCVALSFDLAFPQKDGGPVDEIRVFDVFTLIAELWRRFTSKPNVLLSWLALAFARLRACVRALPFAHSLVFGPVLRPRFLLGLQGFRVRARAQGRHRVRSDRAAVARHAD